MLNKLPQKPLLVLIMVLIIFSGVLAMKGFVSDPEKSDQNMIATLDRDLFINQQTKKTVESPDLALVQKNSLSGVSCPQIFSSKVLGGMIGTEEEEQRKGITEYVVQSGDSLGSIADNFNISLNTLLWANDIGSKSVIIPGQKLIILPVSGAIHYVQEGNTLGEIAEDYEVKVSEIIAFNELLEEGDIYLGDSIIIPGGIKPAPQAVAVSSPAGVSSIPLASGLFIPPVPIPYIITQGLHWRNAIDFAHEGGSCGKPVYAVAGGEVLRVKYGYNYKAGNYVRLLHPNGILTQYGHLQTILVNPGEKISQGEIIGLIGCTGYTIPKGSAGCHLHFEVLSVDGNPPLNPFVF